MFSSLFSNGSEAAPPPSHYSSSWLGGSTADCEPAGMTPVDAVNHPPALARRTSNFVSSPPPISGFDPQQHHDQHHLDNHNQQQNDHPASALTHTKDGRSNPGAFDKADQDALRILKPDIFDGCRFEHNKPLGQNFSVSHSLWLGSAMLQTGNNYQFGTTLVLNEGKTMLLGRVSDDMRVDAQWHQEIIQPQKMVTRVISSVGQTAEQSMTHASVEVNGADYAASIKVAKGPLLAMSYFQSVTKKLDLGAEAFYHHGQGISHVFARGRFKGNKEQDVVNLTASTMSAGSLSGNYVRKVNDRLSLACEMDFANDSKSSHVNVGYEYMLRQCKLSGVLSTDGTLQSQIHEAIAPGFHIIFSAILDYKRDTHRFGYGVQIG